MQNLKREGARMLSLVGTLLAVQLARAADFTWTGVASGSWNETDANWSGAGTVWANGSANDAAFGASGTQNITAASVTLRNLTFSANGYSLSGGPLLMYGGCPSARDRAPQWEPR